MISSLFRNKEINVHLLLITFCMVVFMFVAHFYITIVFEHVNHEHERQNMAVLGRILTENPGLEDTLIPLYTKEVSNAEAEKGYALARKYGLELSLTDISQSRVKEALEQIRNGVILLSLLLFICLLYLSVSSYHNLYAQIRDLSLYTEKIMRGDFQNISLTQTEGDFPLLKFQFNQMAERLRNTLEKLEQEKLLLKNLISDISHQLKTPLSSSLMFHDFLLDDLSTEKREDFVHKSKQQLERINWLIQQLLNLSKLESGAISLFKQNYLFNATVEEVVVSLQQKIAAKQMIIQYENFDEMVYLNQDEKWLSEAIRNIVNNAIDYSHPNGIIKLRLEKKINLLKLLVTDEGIGISKDDLPHIFKRFYQGRKIIPSTEGTGIGLALAKLIIEKHDGRIEVNSEGLGKGTTFILTFHI